MSLRRGDTRGKEVLCDLLLYKEKSLLRVFTIFFIVKGTSWSSQRGDTRGEEVRLRPVRERVQVAKPALQSQEEYDEYL